MENFKSILEGSKRYSFEYGVNGMTVLVIENYYTGEEVRLDLSVLLDHEEVLQEMIELAKNSEE